MRFQTPALAIGLFASLVVSRDVTVRVQMPEGTDDCVLETEGICDPEGPRLITAQTSPFGTYDPEKGCSCNYVPFDSGCQTGICLRR